MYNKVKEYCQQAFCRIIGIGHTETKDSDKFRIVSQEEFIRSLPAELQSEVCRKGASIEETAKIWGEMISVNRTFFSGTISEMAMFAVQRCLDNALAQGAEFDPLTIDAIIGATNTGPGYPSLADNVKQGIGVRSDAMCFDVSEACTAGSVALFQAHSLIKSGVCKNVLVVCAEKATTLTRQENWQGSNLFGDASFAVLLQATTDESKESFDFFSFNSYPFDGNLELIRKTETGFVQDGKKVHIFVVKNVVNALVETVKRAEVALNEVKHLVFHQPSNKTVESFRDYLLPRWPDFKGIFHKSEDIGNASSACFGHLMSKRFHEGIIMPGEKIVTCTFGAGLSVGIIGLHF